MNRIIHCDVDNELIHGAGVVIGAAGSHDDVELELAFSPVWAGTSKKIVWFDALGDQAVVTALTTDLLVPGETEVYRVSVPWEAKAVEGDMKITIRGANTADGKETRAVVAATACFRVLPALWDPLAVESSEPSASVSDQLQQEIEDIKGGLMQVPEAVEDARNSTKNAQASADAAAGSAQEAAGSAKNAQASETAAAEHAQTARQYSGKPPIIQGGTWHIWNADTGDYFDTGLPARGETGDTGAQGPKGDTGATGPAGSGKRVARFTVGTTQSGWTAEQVDYLCDGTDDQVEINAAIQALPAGGGEVVILDGEYTLGGAILVNKDRVTLFGNGQCTVLKRGFAGSSTVRGMIYVTSSYNTIRFLSLDGVKSTYTGSYDSGIYLNSGSNNTVTGNTCNNNYGSGIYLTGGSSSTATGNTCNNNYGSGIYLNRGSNNTVTGNTCDNNSHGISLFNGSNNTVTGNTCNNNDGYGIYLPGGSSNTVTGNTCNNNYGSGIDLSGGSNTNTVTGNTCNNNNYSGIYLSNSNTNTVTGNTCNNNNDSGIYLSKSNTNTVTGNTCIRGNGSSSDYTSGQQTIQVTGSNNLIACNNCMGKNVVDNGTGNTVVNNKYQ